MKEVEFKLFDLNLLFRGVKTIFWAKCRVPLKLRIYIFFWSAFFLVYFGLHISSTYSNLFPLLVATSLKIIPFHFPPSAVFTIFNNRFFWAFEYLLLVFVEPSDISSIFNTQLKELVCLLCLHPSAVQIWQSADKKYHEISKITNKSWPMSRFIASWGGFVICILSLGCILTEFFF